MPKAKPKSKLTYPVVSPPSPSQTTNQVMDNGNDGNTAVRALTGTTNGTQVVVYDRLEVTEFSTATDRGPLTVEEMKDILGWETEDQFKARSVAEYDTNRVTMSNGGTVSEFWTNYITTNPNGTDPNHWLYGDDFHCKNIAGIKVRCTNNLNNRPFDHNWCQDLIHTVLSGQWAGPFTIPGETVNCETIRVSRYGRTISGQHQMTAAILADEYLLRDRENGLDHPDEPKYPTWRGQEHVFLETIIATGMSEDARVLMTVDYVKPRTVADVFYTSSTFRVNPDGSNTSRQDRQELCRVLATACDFLWTRTDARGYRTHLEIVGFLERHPRLLKCVEHLFKLNRATKLGGRKISGLHLSPGQCSSLMYVMGSSGPKTDGDEYRNMDPAPSEKNAKGRDALDWSYWDKSKDFWEMLANGREFIEVRKALGQLVTSSVDSEDNLGMGGRLPEKLAILAKAWERWKDHPETAGPPFSESDRGPDGCLCLNYVDFDATGKKLPNGMIELVDMADFYGVDSPKATGKVSTEASPSKSREPESQIEYTEEEMWKMKEEAQARRTSAK